MGTKVGGVPEIIISDKYGLLVGLRQPQGSGEKILLALIESGSRGDTAYAGRFMWNEIARETRSVYTRF